MNPLRPFSIADPRVYSSHTTASPNHPPAHIAEFRERLHHWSEVAEEALASAAKDSAAQDSATRETPIDDTVVRDTTKESATRGAAAQDAQAMKLFIKKSRAEMDEKLGPVEAGAPRLHRRVEPEFPGPGALHPQAYTRARRALKKTEMHPPWSGTEKGRATRRTVLSRAFTLRLEGQAGRVQREAPARFKGV